MAYFRCGGGGIPASLKSGMNDVLNKKFGTSTTYPPAGWPDNVNLLGPLPIKTASGAIASFSDGSDDVPIAEGKFGIVAQGGGGTPSSPVPIVGFNGMTVYQTGKNLFDKVNGNVVNGYITLTGFSDLNEKAKTVYVEIKGGVTYTVSKTAGQRFQIATATEIPSNNATWTTRQAGNTSSSLTITTSANDKYLWAWIYLEDTDTGTLADMLDSVQIEVGSTATTYEAYKAKTPIQVTWQSEAGTVYGGELYDDGALHVTWGKTTISTLTVTKVATHTFRCNNFPRVYGTNIFNMISASFKTYTQGHSTASNIATLETGNDNTIFLNAGSGTFYISTDSSFDNKSEADFITEYGSIELYYEMNSETVLAIDPIDISTYYGTNNIWCNTGESSIQYRADIQLALNA